MRRLRLQQLVRYAVIALAVFCVFYLLKSDNEKTTKSKKDEQILEPIVKNNDNKINGIGDLDVQKKPDTVKAEHLVCMKFK